MSDSDDGFQMGEVKVDTHAEEEKKEPAKLTKVEAEEKERVIQEFKQLLIDSGDQIKEGDQIISNGEQLKIQGKLGLIKAEKFLGDFDKSLGYRVKQNFYFLFKD